jgi:Uma2 family endonuclease
MATTAPVLDPPAQPADPPAAPADRAYRLGIDQYLEMARRGIIGEDDPVELIEGFLVTKMGRDHRHVHCVRMIVRALRATLPPGYFVAKEDPIATLDSVPEPDATIVRGEEADYSDHWPGPAEVPLVVEVSESSLAYDRTVKKRLYARAGIARYWIVNLIDDRIEVHTDPTGPAAAPSYAQRAEYPRDAEVPVVIDGREVGRIPARDILP